MQAAGYGAEGAEAPRIEIVVVTPFEQNCQVIADPRTGRGIVVDPGGDVARIGERVRAAGTAVEAILLTHGHLDHAGGAEALRTALPARENGTPVPIIGPHRADAFLLGGIAAQARQYGIGGMADAHPDRWLEEGEVLELAGCRFAVLHVPGHSPGSVVFVEHARRFAMVGDTLFKGSVGRTDFPYGDGPELIRGITGKLLPLSDDLRIIPGHGAPSTIGEERRTNLFLR